MDAGIFAVGAVLLVLTVALPAVLDVRNPTLVIAGTIVLFAVAVYAAWSDIRVLRSINAVAIDQSGFWPPFKPKTHLDTGDWRVDYKDITAMEPVGDQGGLALVYDVTLRDGAKFQLSAMDLLVYVDEKTVRRYARLLGVIRAEIEKPENRSRSSDGGDVVIPMGLLWAAAR